MSDQTTKSARGYLDEVMIIGLVPIVLGVIIVGSKVTSCIAARDQKKAVLDCVQAGQPVDACAKAMGVSR